jgi:transcriptional regulator with PAS, ATPase and Fis domain
MLVGRSAVMQDLRARIARVAQTSFTVLIEGESGVGKELVARELHFGSPRKKGPFVAVNCAALPEALAEGELFGYRKGAFTGAEKANLGHFRSAHGGTLLLDEIVDMPLALQSKVLRVLEQREVVPLGESTPQALDVRIVAAAQESLQDAVASKRFRADLMARLNGLTLVLPPLRARLHEIPFLVTRLLSQYAGSQAPKLDARLVEELCLYPWPFNVREVDLLVRRLLTLYAGASVLKRSQLPAEMVAARTGKPSTTSGTTKADGAIEDQRNEREASALAAALRTFGGNVARAASLVGISRQRAYRLMEEEGIDLEQLRTEIDERRPR